MPLYFDVKELFLRLKHNIKHIKKLFLSNAINDDRIVVEVFLINHEECELNVKSDFVAKRCPKVGVTTCWEMLSQGFGFVLEELMN